MKKLLLVPLLVLGCHFAYSQSYKIVISYDANGNRIKRERICISGCSQTLDARIALDPGMHIYPNPTEMTCYIDIPPEWMGGCQVTVNDMTGRQVLNRSLQAVHNAIDMGGLADGAYIFSVGAGNEQKQVKRIVKVSR